jgi:hypothetical protein
MLSNKSLVVEEYILPCVLLDGVENACPCQLVAFADRLDAAADILADFHERGRIAGVVLLKIFVRSDT